MDWYKFFSDGSYLSKPLKIILAVLFYMFIFSISLYNYFNFNSEFDLELLLLICIITLPPFYPCIFYEEYVEKHGMSKIGGNISFQGWSRFISLLAPGGMALFIFFGHNLHHNFMLGIWLSLAFIIPFLALFFRLDVFNDSNCFLDNEIVFGYPPKFYGFSCLALGLFGIYNIFNYYYVDFNYFIICLIIVFLFQTILICPDFFNKFFPFEIRTKKGFIKFIGIVGIIFLIILVLLCGGLFFSNINFDWSLNSILRKIITYGVAIGIAILFYRQAKSMDEKKK